MTIHEFRANGYTWCGHTAEAVDKMGDTFAKFGALATVDCPSCIATKGMTTPQDFSPLWKTVIAIRSAQDTAGWPMDGFLKRLAFAPDVEVTARATTPLGTVVGHALDNDGTVVKTHVLPFVHTGKLAAECIACRANAIAAGLDPDVCFRVQLPNADASVPQHCPRRNAHPVEPAPKLTSLDLVMASMHRTGAAVDEAFARLYFAEKAVAMTAQALTAATKIQDEAEKAALVARRERETAREELQDALCGNTRADSLLSDL